MFRDIVNNTVFNNPLIGDRFNNINSASFQGDNTMTAIMRALLCNRLPENASASCYLKICGSEPYSSVIELFNPDDYERDSLVIIQAEDVNVIKHRFPQVFNCCGFYSVDRINKFFDVTFNTASFISDDRHISVVFVDKIDIRLWHYMAVALTHWFHWYFKGENQLRKDTPEHKLIHSVRSKESDQFYKSLNMVFDDKIGEIAI